jgi:hypothetical protein
MIALALTPAFACTHPQQATSSPTTDDADAELAREADAIPTQDEADAQAASQINATNADAELEKLIKELDSDAKGGG